MLSGVSSMQTGALCARNHRKPGISAACVPASSPPRAQIGQGSYGLCVQDRETDHAPTLRKSAKWPRRQNGRAITRHWRSGDGGATLFEPSDFAALSRPGNVGVEGSAPLAKNGPRAFFPVAPSPPACGSQYGRRRNGLLPLKLRWQARLSGAAGRGQGGAGAAPTPRILPPPRGARPRPAPRPLREHWQARAGLGTRSANHGIAWDTIVYEGTRSKAQIRSLGSQGVGVGWEGGLRRSLRPLP